MDKQQQSGWKEGTHEVSPEALGENRKPDKTIGEVKYAGGQEKTPQEQTPEQKRGPDTAREGGPAYAPSNQDVKGNPDPKKEDR